MNMTVNDTNDKKTNQTATYYEQKIGKTLYRVTSVYMGKFELGKVLEDLTVSKILHDANVAARFK